MSGMFGGGGGGSAPAPPPVVQAPAPIVWQGDDPFAPNYKPPTGPQLSAAQKGIQAASPLAPISPDETLEQRRRREALILGASPESWGSGGTAGVGDAAADAAAADGGDGGDGGGDGN